ncbi:uncharacterized protein F4822DRAFT_391542 [Hypoxylon trugodes]|uniref:uncharacterized protein n=1 Tax=Hypoxylon trugodes TaxID=326681 RepID=UPI00219E15FD|nr:uncharacterized protein F4822DRAFT_391542 [Hypoxylon trugodes]KAI1392614.1 hypothetical protein F4822DRAFT_391542 [Hypoxylon trugodes]
MIFLLLLLHISSSVPQYSYDRQDIYRTKTRLIQLNSKNNYPSSAIYSLRKEERHTIPTTAAIGITPHRNLSCHHHKPSGPRST